MQTHTDAIGDFFHRIRGSRRPAVAAPPPPSVDAVPADPVRLKGRPRRIPSDRAKAVQHHRDNQSAAEKVFANWVMELKPGEHVYRVLKDRFDKVCEKCGLDPISDTAMGTWLRRTGMKKTRITREKILAYTIAPRRSSPRLVAA